MNPITAVILTHNNQPSIGHLIRSLRWCDEVLIIDDQSNDRTRSIARGCGAKVLTRPLRRNFSAQRNFGLQHTSSDWVLFVDSDETVSPGLAREIKVAVKSEVNGFFLKRRDYFLGRRLRYGETGSIRLLRLARRSAGRWRRPVHEAWQVKPPLGTLKTPLGHHPHPTLSDFIDKINYYTDLEAKNKKFFSWFELFFYPPGKFVNNYFFKFGFLDGAPGLVMALMMSWHSLLVRLKLYEKSLAHPAARPSGR